MKKRLLFIYNPHSGTGIIKQNLSDMVDTFVKSGYEVTVHPTQSKGDATKKVIEEGEKFDRIVCSGGDGTLNEVERGLQRLKNPLDIELGYIPSGSTNDFGKSLGLPHGILDATKVSAGNEIINIDMGQFNEEYFVYVAAFGLFTGVSYKTDQNLKNIFGHAAYIFEAIKSLQGNIPSIPLTVESNGETIRGDFIYGMVTNALQVGGLKDFIKGEVELSDGLFEVMLIRCPQNPIELAEIGSFFANVKKDTRLVHTFQTNSIKFIGNDNVDWTLDGEFGGSVQTAIINNLKQSTRFVMK